MNDRAASFTLSKSRFEAFSDGVFAIAITLLILEVHLPTVTPANPTDIQQAHALLGIWPQYLVYAATFATVGIMWVNHHALFRYIERITHGIVMANLLLLGLISFLPFATEVIARYGLSRPTIVYYGLTLIAISVAYLILQCQAIAAYPSVSRAFSLWNVVGLALYPLATLIGCFAPVLGIVIIGLMALFYALPSNVESAAIRP